MGDELDEDFGIPFGVGLGIALAIILALLVFAPLEHHEPPPSSVPLYGCYSTPQGPDILIDKAVLTVLQDPPIRLKSSLIFQKGWTFEIERWLNPSQSMSGSIKIQLGPDIGEFLTISREGEIASKIPRFTLFDRNNTQSIIYEWSGVSCPR